MLAKMDEAKAKFRSELKVTREVDGETKTGQPSGIFVEVNFETRGIKLWDGEGNVFPVPSEAVKPLTDAFKWLMGTVS